MAEYKGVTHTIVEMLARNKIQAVPRKKDTPRTELPEVGRPDDDRFGEVPTRQQEIQKKIIDETQLAADPNKIKKPKKLEIVDIGKQPPTPVVINPDLDNTPTVFASTEVKGKLVTEDPFTAAAGGLIGGALIGKALGKAILSRWPEKGDFTRSLKKTFGTKHTTQERKKSGGWTKPKTRYEETDHDRIKREVDKAQAMQKARKEAEHIAKHVSGLKSFGGFKVTGKLTAKDIEHGADIRRRLNALNKEELEEAGNRYNSVSIQYQTKGGNWITARKTSDSSADIMLAMRNVQKTYSSNRVRAIGARGMVLDFQPIDPRDIETEETSEKELQKAKGRTIEAWWDNKPKSLKNFKQVSKALKKKELDEGGKGGLIGPAVGKALFSGIAVKAALGAVQNNYPTAYGIAQKLKKGWDELPPTPGYTTFARQAPAGNILSAAETVGKYNPELYKKWKQAQDDSVAKNKVSETVDNIVSEILTYRNSARQGPQDAYAQAEAQAQQQQAQAQAAQQQAQPQKKKQQPPVQEAKDPRHTGIEVDEPKFNQSIQRVAAHTKWNADAVHTYKHADGSKTRVDQELGTKIHAKINNTPNRHKAKLVQYIHKSADNLKHVLGK